MKYSGCRCSQKTQGTYEPKLFRKSALKHRLAPAGFPEHLQKLLICSYEHQLMMVNMVTIHRRGVCALSKKVSFMAAYTFPSLFLPSFASVVSPLSFSDPAFHHVFTCCSTPFLIPSSCPGTPLSPDRRCVVQLSPPGVMHADPGLRGKVGSPIWLYSRACQQE